LVQGPAAEIVRSPSERIEVPVIICPHVYDLPPQHNSNGKLLQWNQNKQRQCWYSMNKSEHMPQRNKKNVQSEPNAEGARIQEP
jgi:hypothetical protein